MYNRSVARRVMKNDPDAFRILYDDWAGGVYSMAYDMLGDTALAKNAAAECFIRAWKQAGGLKDERELSEWLTVIARGACTDAAFARRELSETEKEEVWREAAARAGIETREWENTGSSVTRTNESEERAAEEDWKPLIFLPDEEEHAAAADASAPMAVQPAVAAQHRPAKEPERDERRGMSRKAKVVLTGTLAVIAVLLIGGAVILGLAGAGLISLPETLSGAADAIKNLFGSPPL